MEISSQKKYRLLRKLKAEDGKTEVPIAILKQATELVSTSKGIVLMVGREGIK